MIIDVHGHYYSKGLYPLWVPYGLAPLKNWYRNTFIKSIIVSSLDVFSKGFQENNKLTYLCTLESKLFQFITIDPRIPNWQENIPQHKKVLGIKVHPTWSNYNLVDYFEEILEVAQQNNWAVLTHSGIKEPYIDLEESIKIADKYPSVPVIFAHLGNGFTSYSDVLAQVDLLAHTKHNNTLVDTSSLAIHLSGLLEEAVNRIGSERILFGTDLPLHFPSTMLDRVRHADLGMSIKDNILYKNALSYMPKLKEV